MTGPGAADHAEILVELPAARVVREHALDSVGDRMLGFAFHHLLHHGFLESAREVRVLAVDLGLELVARDLDLLRVDHKDLVPAVPAGLEARGVFSHQDRRDPRGEASENEARRVDDDLLGLRFLRCQVE